MTSKGQITINRIKINAFGKIKNKTIDFSPGVNIVYGPNEAGKSTVMAFIKAMLYGFGDSRGGLKSDRKRFSPWSGEVQSGELWLNAGEGKSYVISRAAGRTRAGDREKIIRLETGEEENIEIPKLIGVGEDAFGKTLYIGQLGSQITPGREDEVTQRLINLSQSGREDDNAAAAIERLRAARRHYRHYQGGGGKINEIRGRLRSLTEELAAARGARDKFFADRARLSSIKKEIEEGSARLGELTKEIERARRYEIIAEKTRSEEKAKVIRERLAVQRERVNELSQRLDGMKAFAQEPDGVIFEPAPDMYDKRQAVASLELKKKRLINSSIILSAACAAFIALTFLIPVFFVFALAAAVAAAITFGLAKKTSGALDEAKNALSQAEEKLERQRAALSRYGVGTIKEYTDKRAEYSELLQMRRNENEALLRLEAELSAAEESMRAAVEKAAGMPVEGGMEHPLHSAQELLKTLDELKASMAKKEVAAAALEAELSARTEGLRPIYVIESEIEETKEELSEAENAFEAIELAIDNMEEALAEIRQCFSPRLNACAAEILQKITGGKRGNLLTAADYSVFVDDGGYREIDFFSSGTVDQVYFALRMSIIDMLFPDGKPPLILDDPFAQYDEIRERNAYNALYEYGGQVILFTCIKPVGRDYIELSE